MNFPFINFHTHQEPEQNVTAILNIILKGEQKPEIPSRGYFSCGIHPWYLEKGADKKKLQTMLSDLANEKGCVALGEAGMDKITDVSLPAQEEIFTMQANLAEELDMPLVIHCVKAYAEVLSVRKKLKAAQLWIFHGFKSSLEMAQQLMDHGCMVSLGKALKNKKSKTRDVVSALDAGQFFLETDDDDVSIKELYSLVADLKGISPQDLKKAIYNKFSTVFDTE